jgi:putative heme-binding domain-containing protein
MSADAERGRQLFFREGAASCRGCHRVAGIGETLGPELTLIGKKYPPREMLVHLLEPSKLIDTKFVPWVLETKDGLVHTGLLVEKTAEHVLLKNAQNKEVRVASADVETLVSQQKSLMPELLLRDLTAQQAADLLAYLCSLK